MNKIHDRIQSLIAAYAMGAVPEDEVPAIRSHILSCEACFAEAESYTEALAVLAVSVDPVDLPRGFAGRVLQAARGDATTPAPRPKAASRGRLWRVLVPGVAVLAVISLLGTTAALVRSIDRQRQYEAVVASLVSDPEALSLEGPGGAEAVLASSDDGLVLVAVDLGEAPRGRDYQLWLMKDGLPTPGVTFDVDDSVAVVESIGDLASYDGAAITVEPDGGSSQPTTEPVLSS